MQSNVGEKVRGQNQSASAFAPSQTRSWKTQSVSSGPSGPLLPPQQHGTLIIVFVEPPEIRRLSKGTIQMAAASV